MGHGQTPFFLHSSYPLGLGRLRKLRKVPVRVRLTYLWNELSRLQVWLGYPKKQNFVYKNCIMKKMGPAIIIRQPLHHLFILDVALTFFLHRLTFFSELMMQLTKNFI